MCVVGNRTPIPLTNVNEASRSVEIPVQTSSLGWGRGRARDVKQKRLTYQEYALRKLSAGMLRSRQTLLHQIRLTFRQNVAIIAILEIGQIKGLVDIWSKQCTSQTRCTSNHNTTTMNVLHDALIPVVQQTIDRSHGDPPTPVGGLKIFPGRS